ncbi:hypothetical protein HELRODRAFT_146587, partial [Helobdella robusta]|uniref:Hyaluronan-mediated motility receptor C-terminal domain-containing protein n=1 Tax=Helobdella robusta TaxID=6412 RepID=T1EJT3_HELRO
WKFMYEDLAAKVEPFKDQLEQFELEKQALLSRHKNAQNEVDKLSKEYAKVLGHQNHKQKIHHMVKLKDENLSLKNEVENLRTKDTMNRRRIEKLTEKLDALEGKKKYDPSLAFKNCWENPRETQN